MYFEPTTVDKIKAVSNLYDIISAHIKLVKQGQNYYGKCPMCGKDGKHAGLSLSVPKKVFKCFSCDYAGNNAIQYLTTAQNKTYPEALEYLAKMYNILPDDELPKGKQTKAQKAGKPSTKGVKSFRDKQLESSGLTDCDQKVSVYVDKDKRELCDVYQSATRDQYGQIVNGDDMIIYYYDLEGRPVMYQKPKTTKFEHLFRVRWQNPDLHLDKNGHPIKYQSPAGSGSHIYIPEIVRRAYAAKQYQKRLYIQEGEKKADKACKHGLFSIGIMGIHNIAYNKQLPYEIQLIIKTLQIQEVIFIIDSDFNDLSNNLKPGDYVDNRPRSFYRAVCNFRDYFKAFINNSIYLEIYFGYVLTNEKHDKGIDDLLANTLAKNEEELITDINAALNEKDGEGKYIRFHKITTLAETKLEEIWSLDSSEKFAEKHREKLATLPEFRINRLKWRFNADGKLELAQPLMPEEQYWTIEEWEKNGKIFFKESFDYENAYNFLRNRGYGRLTMADGKFVFVHNENNVISVVDSYAIKDFVVSITKEIAPKGVRNMLYRGAKMYLGPDSLSNLDYIFPSFDRPNRFSQNIYFKNKFWEISNKGIKEKLLSELESNIWGDKLNNFEASIINTPLIEVTRITPALLEQMPDQNREYFANYENQFLIDISEQGEICHFLKFIWNSGDFYWDKHLNEQRKPLGKDTRTADEKMETNLHMVSKMTAIGYMLHRYRNKSEVKAVIAMDGKLSEVGSSNGRTGKSLLGFAFEKLVPITYVGGKQKYLTEDRFIFEEVTEKTCVLFIDDVRVNIDFEFFFPFLGGKATIEKKAIGKFTLPDEQTPKLYISTNHAINGEGSSYRDRQFIIAFSDYYSDEHKPIHDFGIQFFEEWDAEQYNMFYNFMAICIQTYFRFGLVEQPTERIEKRRLRQEIGDEFITWADEYFTYSPETKSISHLNEPIQRSILYDNLLERVPNFKKFYTSNLFKKKLKKWCLYNGLQFNPHRVDKYNRPGADDKSNGIEYFTIGTSNPVTDL